MAVNLRRGRDGASRLVRSSKGPTGRSAKQVLIDAGLLEPGASDADMAEVLRGPPGADEAALIAFDPVGTGLSADNVQTAIVEVWEQLLAPQDDFNLSANSGLGLVLGVF